VLRFSCLGLGPDGPVRVAAGVPFDRSPVASLHPPTYTRTSFPSSPSIASLATATAAQGRTWSWTSTRTGPRFRKSARSGITSFTCTQWRDAAVQQAAAGRCGDRNGSRGHRGHACQVDDGAAHVAGSPFARLNRTGKHTFRSVGSISSRRDFPQDDPVTASTTSATAVAVRRCCSKSICRLPKRSWSRRL